MEAVVGMESKGMKKKTILQRVHEAIGKCSIR